MKFSHLVIFLFFLVLFLIKLTTKLNFSIDVAAESCEDQLAWLKENLDPWATVDKFWRETSAARFQNLVLNKNFSSTDYINSIPALTHVKHGLKLVCLHFFVISTYVYMKNYKLFICIHKD